MKMQLVGAVLASWRLLPEGRLRNAARRLLYRVRVGIPRELLVNSGDTVVLVGMWRADSLRRTIRALGPRGRLILIEANADAVEQARDVVANQTSVKCSVVHAACWHESGTVEFNVAADPAASQVVGVDADVTLRDGAVIRVSVAAVTLDEVCRSHGVDHVDYLEVTVNGAELHVLRGGKTTVAVSERILAAGMMRDPETKQPMNRAIADHLRGSGRRVVISRRGRIVSKEWGRIDGHVFSTRS